MFKGIFRTVAEIKAQTKTYQAQAARVRDEIRSIEARTEEIEAETRIIRAQAEIKRAAADEFMRQVEQDKIKAFHEHAADIERLKHPEIREKAMRTLLESSMGKAARRHFH